MVMPSATRIGPKQPVRVYLQEWRKYNSLTQEQLAGRLGVDKGTVSRWEAGKRIPSINVLAAISEAMDVPLRALYGPPPPKLVPSPPSPPSRDLQAIATEVARILEQRRHR
jgi:transcriptional regulator with XRE-family HTH domain